MNLQQMPKLQVSDVIGSLMIHLLALIGLTIFWQKSDKKAQDPRKFKVSLAKQRIDLGTIRNVGLKKGKKDGRVGIVKPQTTRPSNLTLKSLKPAQENSPLPVKVTSPQIPQQRLKQTALRFHRLSGQEAKRTISLRDNINTSHIKALNHSEFDIKFDPPEGVSEDELNKMEQIFYSFRKRSLESFVSSFMRSFDDFSKLFPNYLYKRENKSVSLLGRVTFDPQGNIKKINIIQAGNEAPLEHLFTKTLEGILKLPNPPKKFIENERDFSVFYRLIVH